MTLPAAVRSVRSAHAARAGRLCPSRRVHRLAFAFLAALSLVAQAQAPTKTPEQVREEAEAERKLDAVRAQIKQIAARQRELEDERAAATRAVREADEAVGRAGRALRETEAAIAAQGERLKALEAQQSRLEDKLSKQREALAALVRSAYALGRHEQLKLLLAQDRVADLARVLVYHRYFQADRSRRIRGLLDELQTLADLARRVETERAALDASRAEQLERVAELEDQRAARATVVADAEQAFKDGRERLAALGRDEGALRKLLEQLRDVLADIPKRIDDARPFATRRGALSWPLAGSVLTGFGGTLPDGRQSDGLLIAASAGSEVRAVSPGRVAFADWMKGYGLILILDHGDGWMTLYASNDALLKDAGDWVRAGEAVASVGSSGGQGKPALYFELRQGGKPVDPRGWLRRR